MNRHSRVLGLVAAVTLLAGSDLLACGDKFLVAGRGTRYQRPKSARAASVLIYGAPGTLDKASLDAALKREGHRATVAETPDQLAAILQSARFDVVLAATNVVSAVREFLGGPEAPVVVAFCPRTPQPADKGIPCVKSPTKERTLLEAIDRAVVERDRNARRPQIAG
jgi:hypothetical protein